MSKKTETLTLTRRQARSLMKEIASVAEAAYRRGAQQAVALGLSKEDAAWYRYFGKVWAKSGMGSLFTSAIPLPQGEGDRKRVAKWRGKLSCVERMEWSSNVDGKGPFKELAHFADQQ